MNVLAKKKDDGQPGKFKQFWRDKRHHQIYFFSCSVLALVLAFSINLASISIMYNQKVAAKYANTTLFTPNTVTSLSGTPIQVMMCRVSRDKDQMFILLKMGDMTNIGMDISNYELWVTNADKNMKRSSKPAENLKGQYYMFGATG